MGFINLPSLGIPNPRELLGDAFYSLTAIGGGISNITFSQAIAFSANSRSLHVIGGVIAFGGGFGIGRGIDVGYQHVFGTALHTHVSYGFDYIAIGRRYAVSRTTDAFCAVGSGC